MSIAQNAEKILGKIRLAATSVGRDSGSIILCAATKTNNAERVKEAIQAGITCCGENRVQELTEKLAANAYAGASVHFIGHLQTNKVKQVVGKVDLIQSVDSLRLLESIDKEAARQEMVQDILLEVNIAGEASKGGFSVDELWQLLPEMSLFHHVRVLGLMTIPPICQNSGDNSKFFQEMYNLSVDITAKKYDNVLVDILSMGMSDDYADAIRCGSSMVRVGTAIFGARDYSRSNQN